MSKSELVRKARDYNRHAMLNSRKGLFWAADLAAKVRDEAMSEARKAV